MFVHDAKCNDGFELLNPSLRLQGSKATGAFILTASHNPGGPTEVRSVLVPSLLCYPFI